VTARWRWAGAALAAAVLAAGCSGGGSTPKQHKASPFPNYTSPPSSLPAVPVSLSTSTKTPWFPPALINNGANSAAYVKAAGFGHAPSEMLTVHYHAHLDIIINGKHVLVPPYIGWVAKGRRAIGLAPLHTHDGSGLIHIENSVPATFILGQLYVEWGVRLSSTCVGGYCSGNGSELAVFVNGQRYDGDPTQIVLKKHEEIAIEFGPTGKLPRPPSRYSFPSGD
jgi:hypothetical protein